MTEPIKNLLADKGYEIIALPKADIAPLLLLCKQGDSLTPYGGKLLDLFEPDEAGIPLRTTNTADISGTKVLTAEFSTGFDLLSGIFQALKLKDSKLKAKLSASKDLQISFAYEDIEEEKVDLIAIDNFVAGSIPRKAGFQRSLELLKDSDLYVVVSVLKSATFSVTLGSMKEQQADVETTIQDIVDLSTHIQRKQGNEFSIRTVDGQPLAFAYKAARIIYDKKKWFEFWKAKEAGFRVKNQIGMVLLGPDDFPIQPLKTSTGISNF